VCDFICVSVCCDELCVYFSFVTRVSTTVWVCACPWSVCLTASLYACVWELVCVLGSCACVCDCVCLFSLQCLGPHHGCDRLLNERDVNPNLSVSLSLCLSVSLSLRLSVSPSLRLSVSPSLRLSVSLSLCLSVSPSVSPSLRLYACLPVRLSPRPPSVFLSPSACRPQRTEGGRETDAGR